MRRKYTVTKKDYIIIAKCLNEAYKNFIARELPYSEHYEYALTHIVGKFIKEFPKDNPRFDWQAFKKAVYK